MVKVCCICGKEFIGYGNNPYPIRSAGKCCDLCNIKVIEERMRLLSEEQQRHIEGEDTEYIRTDAFIEKAATWLREQEEMVGVSFQDDFIERFKDYMKGK